ncbi:MAG: hypothetical protein ACYTEO_19870 [Planctomycetota bacterium]|jgi:hypothetical protein
MKERVLSDDKVKVTVEIDGSLAKRMRARANALDKTQARYISDLVSADLAHEDANVRALAQMGITGRTGGVVE